MEFKAILPKAASQSSGSSPSSSSSSSSVSSHDSDNETSVISNSVGGESNRKLKGGGSGGFSDGESDNGGFVSGEEEFEAAPEMPIDEVAKPDLVGGESGDKVDDDFGGTSGVSLMSEIFRPVAKLSNDDDYDDEDDLIADEWQAKVSADSLGVAPEEKGVFVDRKLRESGELLDASADGDGGVGAVLGGATGSLVNQKDNLTGTLEYGESLSAGVELSSVAEAEAEAEVENKDVEEKKGDAWATVKSFALSEDEASWPSIFSGNNQADSEVAEPADEMGNILDDGIVDKGANILDSSNKSFQDGINALTDSDGRSGTTIDNEEKHLVEVEPGLDSIPKQDDLVMEVSADESCNEGKAQAVDSVTGHLEPTPVTEVQLAESNGTVLEAQELAVEDEISRKVELYDRDLPGDSEDYQDLGEDETGAEGSDTDGDNEDTIFERSQAAKQFLDELERAQSSEDHSQQIDGQIVTDSDEEVDTDDEGDGKELFDSAALAALLKAATGADTEGGNITITSQDGSRLFSVERPAGLGSSLRSLKPAPRPSRPSLFSSNMAGSGESENNLTEEEKKKLEKIQQLRVKFLRLVQRLGYSPEDSLAQQVMYRLALVAGRQTSQLFSLDSAKKTAADLESEGKDDLNFSLNILVLGKAGVGKSATINSIFGEAKAPIHAFQPSTQTVKEIVGTVNGVKVRVFDTPSLKTALMDQNENRKILTYIKKYTKKCPPDIVLYVDRLDTQTRDLNDLPMLKTITSCLGTSIWRSAVVTLTHAASAPPDGPSGSPLNYDAFVTQRSHVVQQSIGQAVGDLRLMNPSLMNPVSLVENHPSCRKNRDGEKVLPNGQTWRPQLLLLCYSMKILSEASSLSKPQDPFDHRKLFGFRVRSPPLPYLLSWLLQSRTHPKLSTDQTVENGDSDVDLADLSDSDEEDEEDEYEQLPPFKSLNADQIGNLSRDQKKAYFEEYDYRVKLLQKKQWREELKRMREIKKKGQVSADEPDYVGEDADADNGTPATVPVPLHDMVLPPSFDSDNPAFRYRFLEPTSQFVARPVLDTHGWDHDCGYDGVNVEHSLAIASKFPAAVALQITKDKKEFNMHLDSSVATKLGENASTMAGFDIQNIGKQLAYIIRGESKFKSFRKNKTAAGVSVTFLGENVATGLKVEDQLALGKRLVLVGSAGTVRSRGDSVYGANLEVRLREADFPIGQDQSSLGLSLVRWRGDLALGANFQSQLSIGRSSKIAVRAGLNNKLSGQITVKTSSTDQLQIALVALLPIANAVYKNFWPGAGENYSAY